MNSLFWFRRDLRLDDNTALLKAIQRGNPVLTVFIFDDNITKELDIDDPRISFIHDNILGIDKQLHNYNSSLLILKGNPKSVIEKLVDEYNISDVYANKDYEQIFDIYGTLQQQKIYLTSYLTITIDRDNLITKHLMQKDRLGSTTQVLDEQGVVLHTKSYDAFGKPRNGDWSDMGTVGNQLFKAMLEFSAFKDEYTREFRIVFQEIQEQFLGKLKRTIGL